MKNNQLSQLALAALVLTAASPTISHASERFVVEQSFQAFGAGCEAHGCGTTAPRKGQVVDSSGQSYSPADSYKIEHVEVDKQIQYKPASSQVINAEYGKPHPANTPPKPANAPISRNNEQDRYNGSISYADGARTASTAQMNRGANEMMNETIRIQNGRFGGYYNDPYNNPYNRNRPVGNYPNYRDDRRGAYDDYPYPYGSEYGDNININPQYPVDYGLDYYNQIPTNGPVPVNQTPAAATAATVLITETQLIDAITPDSRDLYRKLSPAGKATAIQLASQDVNRDKNQAVQDAARLTSPTAGKMVR